MYFLKAHHWLADHPALECEALRSGVRLKAANLPECGLSFASCNANQRGVDRSCKGNEFWELSSEKIVLKKTVV
jgi:hypothetical protein